MARPISIFGARFRILSAAIFTAALASACGGATASRATPTSPTATGNRPAPATTGATITGTVVTGVSTGAWTRQAVGITVTVNGTGLTTTADGNGGFTLTGVPTGHVDLHFVGAGADAHLGIDNVADHETIEIHVRVSGNQAEIDDGERETPDHHIEIEGRIANVNTLARTLRVGTATVSVPAGTPIHHGGTAVEFAQLHVDDLVHIQATDTGGTVTAQDVEVQTDHGTEPGDNPGDDHGNDHAELTGTVSAKSGTCPTLTFSVGSTTVKTNASTEFHDTTCSALANGDRVEVTGVTQSANVVLATRVEKDN